MKAQNQLPKISYNNYWVLPDAPYDRINGMYLFDNFDPSKRLAITGKVIACPEYILNSPRMPIRALGARLPAVQLRKQRLYSAHACEQQSQVVVEIDDKVWFNYNQHFSIIKWEDSELWDKPLILLHHDQIYMLERDNKQEMCNGYIWVEQIPFSEEEIKGQLLTTTWQSKSKAKLGVGIIKQVGKPNISYRDEPNKYHDQSKAKVGDKIYFRNTAPSAEWHTHQELNKNGPLPYLKIQRKDILAYVL